MRRLRRACVLAALALAGCSGGIDVGGGAARPVGPRVQPKDLDAAELLPKDLDVAIRIDVERLRSALGKEAFEKLVTLSGGQGDGGLIRRALPNARTIVLGLRFGDVGVGDRVLAMEGNFGIPDLVPPGWEKRESARLGTWILEAGVPPPEVAKTGGERRGPAPRDAFVRAVLSGQRTLALVSAAEVDPVARILRDGPDAVDAGGRRDPRAEGVFSVDLRVRPLSPGLAQRFQSIAEVIAGLDRAAATAEAFDGGIEIRAEIRGTNAAGAELCERFLRRTLAGLAKSKYETALRATSMERVGKVLHVKLQVSSAAIHAAL